MFKKHTIVGINICDERFLYVLWYKLRKEAQATLNIIKTSNIHPKLSAYHVWKALMMLTESLLLRPAVAQKSSTHQKYEQDGDQGPLVHSIPAQPISTKEP